MHEWQYGAGLEGEWARLSEEAYVGDISLQLDRKEIVTNNQTSL